MSEETLYASSIEVVRLRAKLDKSAQILEDNIAAARLAIGRAQAAEAELEEARRKIDQVKELALTWRRYGMIAYCDKILEALKETEDKNA